MKNSHIEGDCTIKSISSLRLRTNMIYISIILSILTAGIFLLFFRFSIKFTKFFLYSNSSFKECTHFLIENNDKSLNIVKK